MYGGGSRLALAFVPDALKVGFIPGQESGGNNWDESRVQMPTAPFSWGWEHLGLGALLSPIASSSLQEPQRTNLTPQALLARVLLRLTSIIALQTTHGLVFSKSLIKTMNSSNPVAYHHAHGRLTLMEESCPLQNKEYTVILLLLSQCYTCRQDTGLGKEPSFSPSCPDI